MKSPVTSDVAIPIVFPDYTIKVDIKSKTLDVPDLPLIDIPFIPNKIHTPKFTQHLPFLGHAGIAFFEGKSGMTQYYEYGRYDKPEKGLTRKVDVPNVAMVAGKPTELTLKSLLNKISNSSGQAGQILGAYIELPSGSYAKMLAYSQKRMAMNPDPKRKPYDLTEYSCCHFMQSVAKAGGAAMPDVSPPHPSGYIRVVRGVFEALDYSKTSGVRVDLLGYPFKGGK